MANEENLIPMSERSKDEVREIASRGGVNSGVARREKKLMKDQMALLLSLPIKDESIKERIKELGIDDENIDNQMAIVLAMWQKAIKGNVKASEFIRDTLGEKPAEKVELNASVSEVAGEIDNYVNGRKD